MQSLELAKKLGEAMADVRAGQVLVLDLESITDAEGDSSHLGGLIDAFVVGTATGGSSHIRAIREAVKDEHKKHSHYPVRKEGSEVSGWVLLDFGDVIVHVMSEDIREYYALEDLWGDAPRFDMETED